MTDKPTITLVNDDCLVERKCKRCGKEGPVSDFEYPRGKRAIRGICLC